MNIEELKAENAALRRQLAENHHRAEIIIAAREKQIERLQANLNGEAATRILEDCDPKRPATWFASWDEGARSLVSDEIFSGIGLTPSRLDELTEIKSRGLDQELDRQYLEAMSEVSGLTVSDLEAIQGCSPADWCLLFRRYVDSTTALLAKREGAEG